jgi:UDP-N-acetylmuramoylalanine--D-glutamate ligase
VSRRALVVGLGRSGRAAAALLARRGWRVVAVDGAAVDAPELADAGVEVRAPWAAPVEGVDLVVKSPGVPGAAPPVAAARAAGAPVWSEIELAARELPNPLLAVTGTNGKTTTTELTAHLLRAAGIEAHACGNQGTPLAGLVDRVDPRAWLVVECSSFQLEDVHTFHPAGAVLLNLAPDHLDRHGDEAAYLAAKLRVFAAQEPADLAIAPAGIDATGGAPTRRLYDGAPGLEAAAWGEGGLHLAALGLIAAWEDVPLRGRHNRENAMAAAALAAHAGAGAAALAEGLASFRPVPHRLELVGTAGGVAFVNDSKATNPDAALAALDAYDHGVHLIAGGRAKGTPFAALAAAARGAVVRAYLVGEAAPQIATALDAAGVPHEAAGGVAEAVALAAERAKPGETVLLAPGCASFDQFSSYEERGEAFRVAARAAGASTSAST